jgi:hypothetical protein
MADDQEKMNFEIVKLRIAFLQHITTLSGAAILIIFALIQRAETGRSTYQLASIVSPTRSLSASLRRPVGMVTIQFTPSV